MCEHCFVVVLFSAMYVHVRILLSNILSVYSSTWKSNVNLTILRNYSGTGRACASSQYQAVFLLPSGLGTRLSMYMSMCEYVFASTVLSRASAHGHSQLKRQKLRVGSYTEKELKWFNYPHARVHRRCEVSCQGAPNQYVHVCQQCIVRGWG